jgi:hypothetical protein
MLDAPEAARLAEHMVNRAATSDLASALDLEAYSQGLAVAADDHTPRFTGR